MDGTQVNTRVMLFSVSLLTFTGILERIPEYPFLSEYQQHSIKTGRNKYLELLNVSLEKLGHICTFSELLRLFGTS